METPKVHTPSDRRGMVAAHKRTCADALRQVRLSGIITMPEAIIALFSSERMSKFIRFRFRLAAAGQTRDAWVSWNERNFCRRKPDRYIFVGSAFGTYYNYSSAVTRCGVPGPANLCRRRCIRWGRLTVRGMFQERVHTCCWYIGAPCIVPYRTVQWNEITNAD